MNNKNILITGGAGHIGKNLAINLKTNNNVTILDNNFFGRGFSDLDDIEIIKLPTLDIEKLDNRFDLIYHLGEYSRVEQSFQDYRDVIKLNIQGTYEVIKFAKKNQTKLVYAGSSTRFASADSRSPYSITKKYNAEMIATLNDMNVIEAACVYFFNVYGPFENSDEKYGTVIAKFLKRYHEKKPLLVTLPGSQMRNFTHVIDVVNGLKLVGEHGLGDNYQIGAEKKYSILEVAKMISDNIHYQTARPGNRLDAVQDLTKMSELGWQAKESLPDYINNMKDKTVD